MYLTETQLKLVQSRESVGLGFRVEPTVVWHAGLEDSAWLFLFTHPDS